MGFFDFLTAKKREKKIMKEKTSRAVAIAVSYTAPAELGVVEPQVKLLPLDIFLVKFGVYKVYLFGKFLNFLLTESLLAVYFVLTNKGGVVEIYISERSFFSSLQAGIIE